MSSLSAPQAHPGSRLPAVGGVSVGAPAVSHFRSEPTVGTFARNLFSMPLLSCPLTTSFPNPAQAWGGSPRSQSYPGGDHPPTHPTPLGVLSVRVSFHSNTNSLCPGTSETGCCAPGRPRSGLASCLWLPHCFLKRSVFSKIF